MAILFVPEALRTSDLCQVAVAQNPAAFPHVPLDSVTPAIERLAGRAAIERRGERFVVERFADD
jgi:hypothetical protein